MNVLYFLEQVLILLQRTLEILFRKYKKKKQKSRFDLTRP